MKNKFKSYVSNNQLHYFIRFDKIENNVTLFNGENLYEMKIESPIMHASSRSDRQC